MKLGERLVAQNTITEAQCGLALFEQAQHHGRFGDTLLKLGFVDEAQLITTLGVHLGIETPALHHWLPQAECLDALSPELIRRELCLPISLSHHQGRPHLAIALRHPQDLIKLDRIRQTLPAHWQIQTCLAGSGALALTIERIFGNPHPAIDRAILAMEAIDGLSHNPYHGNAVIPLADELIAEAVERGASDIHFEPEPHVLRIRLRIDGLLQTTRLLRAHIWSPLLVRLKLLNGLDISDTRHPQDGRMTLALPGRTIDIRTSAMPTLHGENLVMRLLDRNKGIRPLSELGLDPNRMAQLQRLLAIPEGLMLVIGPTGSGKTTTLYAMLQHLQNDSLQIMTLEDPVEYALPGIRQTAIDPPRLDFANGIRAMMRQDPDVLLIGEIRDEETAAMALRAAQTGHRVFSTLHASCPFTALPRLQQLQISLQGLRGSLTGILSQRLIRQLCPACAEQRPASASDQALLGISEPIPLRHPLGCPACHGTGYRGRLPLLEILPFPPALESLLDDRHRLGHFEIQQMATAAGWESLAAHGRQRVLAGQTSLAELLRTIDPANLQAPH